MNAINMRIMINQSVHDFSLILSLKPMTELNLRSEGIEERTSKNIVLGWRWIMGSRHYPLCLLVQQVVPGPARTWTSGDPSPYLHNGFQLLDRAFFIFLSSDMEFPLVHLFSQCRLSPDYTRSGTSKVQEPRDLLGHC